MTPEEEYRKKGYSRISLEMLDSEEGQRNAIYALYGNAVAECQFLEDAVRGLVTRVYGGTAPPPREGLKNLVVRLNRRVTLDDEKVWSAIHGARKVRNQLVHRFWRNKERKMATTEGRLEVLMELKCRTIPIERSKRLLNGISFAFDRITKKKGMLAADEEIEISISDDIKKTHLPPYPLRIDERE